MINRINKKGGAGIAITLFVLATFVLCFIALFNFNIKKVKYTEGVYTSEYMENILSKKSLLNFYIQDIIDKSTKSGKTQVSDLILEILKNIEFYRSNDGSYLIPELAGIAEQINSQTVSITDGNLRVVLVINIAQNIRTEEGEDILQYDYKYLRDFESKLIVS
ncbi:MAG TPA: hypothetical protein P5277_03805 [Candidatus Paceibacterota bacterium]|nr:hypothetical protein [Candidatus Paceibacterota bacterium]